MGAAIAAFAVSAPAIAKHEWEVTGTPNNKFPKPLMNGEIGRYDGVRFFEPSKRYGNSLSIFTRSEAEAREHIEKAADTLIDDARMHIPRGQRIQILYSGEMDFGNRHDVAWLYSGGKDHGTAAELIREVVL